MGSGWGASAHGGGRRWRSAVRGLRGVWGQVDSVVVGVPPPPVGGGGPSHHRHTPAAEGGACGRRPPPSPPAKSAWLRRLTRRGARRGGAGNAPPTTLNLPLRHGAACCHCGGGSAPSLAPWWPPVRRGPPMGTHQPARQPGLIRMTGYRRGMEKKSCSWTRRKQCGVAGSRRNSRQQRPAKTNRYHPAALRHGAKKAMQTSPRRAPRGGDHLTFLTARPASPWTSHCLARPTPDPPPLPRGVRP